jgi:hypothetical protein
VKGKILYIVHTVYQGKIARQAKVTKILKQNQRKYLNTLSKEKTLPFQDLHRTLLKDCVAQKDFVKINDLKKLKDISECFIFYGLPSVPSPDVAASV